MPGSLLEDVLGPAGDEGGGRGSGGIGEMWPWSTAGSPQSVPAMPVSTVTAVIY